MTRDELIIRRDEVIQLLSEVNATISAVLSGKNKSYTYSNQESTHQATTQSLSDLRELRDSLRRELISIDNQLYTGTLIQIKNV